MAVEKLFYRDRLEEARLAADSATLANVRDRWLRSEASWSVLAARSAHREQAHARMLADKGRERAALKAES